MCELDKFCAVCGLSIGDSVSVKCEVCDSVSHSDCFRVSIGCPSLMCSEAKNVDIQEVDNHIEVYRLYNMSVKFVLVSVAIYVASRSFAAQLIPSWTGEYFPYLICFSMVIMFGLTIPSKILRKKYLDHFLGLTLEKFDEEPEVLCRVAYGCGFQSAYINCLRYGDLVINTSFALLMIAKVFLIYHTITINTLLNCVSEVMCLFMCFLLSRMLVIAMKFNVYLCLLKRRFDMRKRAKKLGEKASAKSLEC